MPSNTIRVDRGTLFDVLRAAEALLNDEGDTYLATESPARLEEVRESCETLRDNLLGG